MSVELDYQNVSTDKSVPSEQQCLAWLNAFLPQFKDLSELTVRIVDEDDYDASKTGRFCTRIAPFIRRA